MKTFKKILALLIAVCMLPLAALALENDAVIRVNGGIAAPGETVEVTIALENNPGLASAKLLVEFDTSVLTLKAVEDAGVLGTQVHKPELVNPYQLNWANDTATENYTYNGTVVTLTFQVADDALEGDTPITVSYDYDNYEIIDYNMKPVRFDVANGVVTVGEVPATDISLFEYSLSGTELTITEYIGEEAKVVIGESYEIGGTEYTVVAIGEEAFAENEIIESLALPSTLKEIEDYAFYLCENLKKVTFSEGLETIGADAFDGCASLTEICLPNSLVSLGEYAFYDCISLTSVTVLNSETELGDLSLGYYYISRKEDGLVDGFLLMGHKESTAIDYAYENGLTFMDMFAFKGASLVLQDNLAINYKVNKVLFENAGYTNPYVLFEMNGKETRVDSYKVDGDCYVFTFDNIAPQQMGDVITSTLYATFKGEECESESREYSVLEYCNAMLPLAINANHTELGTLLVDLLHYGAASQIYAGYKTDALVNAALTAEQLALGTVTDPSLKTVLNAEYETVENPTAEWVGAGLYLEDSVTLRFKLSAESLEGATLKVESANKTWNISASELVKTGDDYYLYFDKLNAGQMSEELYLTVYQNDQAISNTVCYSIESYAYEMQDSTIPNLAALVKAMMNYGNAAYAYVH